LIAILSLLTIVIKQCRAFDNNAQSIFRFSTFSTQISFFHRKHCQMQTLLFVVVIALARTLHCVKGEKTCPTGWKHLGWQVSGFELKKRCLKDCPDGLVDEYYGGITCRRALYARGVGYVWSPGSSGQSKCEADKGVGNCEKWGVTWYQKCREGWYSVGCCLCEPKPILDCEALYNLTSARAKFQPACLKESMVI
jgi:hypothetical protein